MRGRRAGEGGRGAAGRARPERARPRAARAARARGDEVSVLFCADARMRSLNRRYRGKDRSTDVLAFPGRLGGRGLLGDIVISVPYAAREARRRARAGGRGRSTGCSSTVCCT